MLSVQFLLPLKGLNDSPFILVLTHSSTNVLIYDYITKLKVICCFMCCSRSWFLSSHLIGHSSSYLLIRWSVSMANTDAVSVRVFSLNCWSGAVVCWLMCFSFLFFIWYIKAKSHCLYSLCFFFAGASDTSANTVLSVTPWLEICCARRSTMLSCCRR